jgi:hypothetical protein
MFLCPQTRIRSVNTSFSPPHPPAMPEQSEIFEDSAADESLVGTGGPFLQGPVGAPGGTT